MGTKRVGLARMEALIENLKRSLNLGTATISLESLTSEKDVVITAGTVDIADGGAVVQASSKTTGVTLNTHSGKITMHNGALAAAAEVIFTVTNSKCAATDIVVVNHASAGTAGDYLVQACDIGAGSFKITVANIHASTTHSEAIVLHFALIKMKHS